MISLMPKGKNTYVTELYFQRSKTSEQVFAAVTILAFPSLKYSN